MGLGPGGTLEMGTAAWQGIKVAPNPAMEGGKVTIRGKKGATVFINPPSGKQFSVKLDGNGIAKIPVPGKAGEEFLVSDSKWPETTEVAVPIINS